MAKLMRGLWVGWLALGMTACAFTDPGNGTNTLEVVLDALYDANAADNTQIQVAVNQGGLRVTNANVLLTDADTGQNFTLDQNSANLIPGYHRHMQMRVNAGADELSCALEGPSRHTITKPLSGEQHALTDDLKVNYQTPDGLHADRSVVTAVTAGYTTTDQYDNGWFTIPQGTLRPGSETVQVDRITQVVPAGGTGASRIQSTYRVKVGFSIR